MSQMLENVRTAFTGLWADAVWGEWNAYDITEVRPLSPAEPGESVVRDAAPGSADSTCSVH